MENPPRPTLPEHDFWYDLKPFVESKRLGWMDKTDSGARLCFDGDGEFPYYGIEGRKDPYWIPIPDTREEDRQREQEYAAHSREIKERAAENRKRKREERERLAREQESGESKE